MPRHSDSGKSRNVPALAGEIFTFLGHHWVQRLLNIFVDSSAHLRVIDFDTLLSCFPCITESSLYPSFKMSVEDKPVQQEAPVESQFQKPGDLVERNEDTGVMSLESLCMNCHENVRLPAGT